MNMYRHVFPAEEIVGKTEQPKYFGQINIGIKNNTYKKTSIESKGDRDVAHSFGNAVETSQVIG